MFEMKNVYYAPAKIISWTETVFLAGTIDMGASENWQGKLATQLYYAGFSVLSPRRLHWDNSLEQSIYNPVFREQVEWELEGLEKSTYRLFNFLPDSKSPITLLELGLVCNMQQHKKDSTFVVCPKEFYRRGNVEIMCHRFQLKLFETMEDAFNDLSMFRYSGIISKKKPLTDYDW